MELAEYENLKLEILGSVLRVTLDRPGRRNALSAGLLDELMQVISASERDTSISVLILRGAGQAFCSGYDVTPDSSASKTPDSPLERVQEIEADARVFHSLWRCAIPALAQVHGHCLNAGADLALSCDFVICAADARIGYPAVRSMGVPATHMWLYHLGPQWAKRLLLTGDCITGAMAAELGLALNSVPSEALDTQVLDLATRISRVPRDLLIEGKHLLNHGLDLMGRSLLQEAAARQSALSRLSLGAGTFTATALTGGVRQAIAERDAPFAAGDPIGLPPRG